MSAESAIEWTEATWNPLTGCQVVSPGCDNCYAAREAAGRLSHHPAYVGLAIREEGHAARFTGEVRLLPDRLDQPLRWKRPRRIFVNSMSDLFHPSVPDEFIEAVLSVMTIAKQHTFQVLTKRPQRMAQVLQRTWWDINGDVHVGRFTAAELGETGNPYYDVAEHLPHVWWGTSVESQTYAFRVRHLLDTPAAVRWVSAEPLLGPLDLFGRPEEGCDEAGVAIEHHGGSYPTDYGTGVEYDCSHECGIDWVVVGGESGPSARPMHPAWARSLRDQCQEFGVAFLFKQWGEWGPALLDDPGPYHEWSDGNFMARHGKKIAGRHLDGRTWDEYPT